MCCVCVPSECSLPWARNNLPVYLSHPRTWLLWSRGIKPWLMSIPLAPARGHTFTTRALIGPSSHVRKCSRASWKNLHHPRLPGGATVTKRNPHCLHPFWKAVTSIISFTEMFTAWRGSQLGNVKHQEGERSVHLFSLFAPETFSQNECSIEHT